MSVQKFSFSIGTFNVRNLALPDIYFYPGEHYTKHDYEKKLNWIREQIIKMDCDIIGFQEIFHEEALLACLKGTKCL